MWSRNAHSRKREKLYCCENCVPRVVMSVPLSRVDLLPSWSSVELQRSLAQDAGSTLASSRHWGSHFYLLCRDLLWHATVETPIRQFLTKLRALCHCVLYSLSRYINIGCRTLAHAYRVRRLANTVNWSPSLTTLAFLHCLRVHTKHVAFFIADYGLCCVLLYMIIAFDRSSYALDSQRHNHCKHYNAVRRPCN